MGGKFVISLDFEKYWGVRDHKNINEYKNNLENVDEVVKELLEKFRNYEIHATWAIVGFMFFANKQELMKNLPENKEIYTNRLLNPYVYIEQEQLDVKYHFAVDSIDTIASMESQEIASHTYSHYYCLEEGQNDDNFKEDMRLFLTLCTKKNLQVSTIIFPRNQINEKYISILKNNGITAFRGNESWNLHRSGSKSLTTKIVRVLRIIDRYINITGHNTYSINKGNTIYDVKASRFLAPYKNKQKILESLKLRRIKKSMTYAAKKNETFHLWWHPHNFGDNMSENMKVLDSILNHYIFLKREYGMESKNIREIVEEL